MTATFWLSTGQTIKRLGRRIGKAALGAAALVTAYLAGWVWLQLSQPHRDRVSFAVVILTIVGWLYWLTSRSQLVLTRAENSEDRTEQLHDRQDDLQTRLWEVIDWIWQQQEEPDPETEPMRRIGTDTVETERVIDEGMDEFLAAARARWAEIAAGPVEAAPAEKPSPTARTRTRTKKATDS